MEVTISIQQLMAEGKKYYEKNCSVCGEYIIYFHKSKEFPKPEICPKCGEVYWDKPLIEVELFRIQNKYLEADSENKKEYIGQMYKKLVIYAERLIKNKMKAKKILSAENLQMASHDASAIMLQRFLENPEYITHSSFGGNLKKILSGVLFGDARNDSLLSLDYSKNGESSFGDFVTEEDEDHYVKENGYEEDILKTSSVEDTGITEDLASITAMFSDEIRNKDAPGSILFLAGVYNTFLKKNKQSMSMFYTTAGSEIKQALDYYQLYVRNYLKNGECFEHRQ